MYNWYAGTDSRKIAPIGWHVPSETEWTTLVDALGGYASAGGKLKEAGTYGWNDPNVGATNETGFSGRGGGCRYQNGTFDRVRIFGYFWSITEKPGSKGFSTSLWTQTAILGFDNYWFKTEGMSVRCIKD